MSEVKHDLYKDSAILKPIENGYVVVMSARNTSSPVNDSYDVEKFFPDFKSAWEYLRKMFDTTEHTITIKVEG